MQLNDLGIAGGCEAPVVVVLMEAGGGGPMDVTVFPAGALPVALVLLLLAEALLAVLTAMLDGGVYGGVFTPGDSRGARTGPGTLTFASVARPVEDGFREMLVEAC